MRNTLNKALLIACSCLLAGAEFFLIIAFTANYSSRGSGIV